MSMSALKGAIEDCLEFSITSALLNIHSTARDTSTADGKVNLCHFRQVRKVSTSLLPET